MKTIMQPYNIRHETDMVEPLDFNRISRLKDVDKCFKAEITNVIRLTDMEKLFQIRMVNDKDWERFVFLPGQFVMLELPGYGEIPISFSSSPSVAESKDIKRKFL